jgi:hypothetical protein
MTNETGFWFIQFKDLINIGVLLVTVAAIMWGPIIAVRMTKKNDYEKERQRQRFEVFRTLMKTRRMTLSQEHVMALNTVMVDFFGQKKIEAAYQKYLRELEREPPLIGDPSMSRFLKDRADALHDLIHEIGAELGYSYDKRDMTDFSYCPQGWFDELAEQRQLRALLIKVLAGEAPLPITEYDKLLQGRAKFPPPPRAA